MQPRNIIGPAQTVQSSTAVACNSNSNAGTPGALTALLRGAIPHDPIALSVNAVSVNHDKDVSH